MGLISWIKEKLKMLFKTDTEKAFGVETYLSPEMEKAIQLWKQMEMKDGKPPWVSKKVETIRFSNTIAEELARLITQNIDIKVQGDGARSGEMPKHIQGTIDSYFLQNASDHIYSMIAFGGIMAKWDGKGIEFLRPDMFLVTEFDSNKDIWGAIFFSYYSEGKKHYTRAEWHRFEETTEKRENGEMTTIRKYHISNKAFRSDNQEEIGREVPLSATKWADLLPEFEIENLKKPLFRYIKCPTVNNVDHDSPLGVPCFSNCITELKLLDTAMSTLGIETKNSTPMMIVDQSVVQYATMNGIELPEFISNIGLDLGNGDKPVEQWQPTLQVVTRTQGINFYLSVIGFKCGFDPGYFVFDGQNIVMATATQVESTQQRVINTVSSYRSVLDRPESNGDGRVGAIHDIAYIINAMLIINGKISDEEDGNYKLFCKFDDLTKNAEEEKMFDYQLSQNGYMAKWKFLVLHKGYTEEEAKQMVAEAQKESAANREGGLFGEE